MIEDEILELLLRTPQITTTEIAKKLNASRTTIIHHLKILKEKGKVCYRKVGSAKLWSVTSEDEAEKARLRVAALKEDIFKLIDEILPLAETYGFPLSDQEAKKLQKMYKLRKQAGRESKERLE